MKQGYNDRMDDSLGNREGKESSKEQNYKDRRDEAKAMNKAEGKRAYQSVESMDKNSFDKTWAKFKADTKKAFGGDKYAKGGSMASGGKLRDTLGDGYYMINENLAFLDDDEYSRYYLEMRLHDGRNYEYSEYEDGYSETEVERNNEIARIIEENFKYDEYYYTILNDDLNDKLRDYYGANIDDFKVKSSPKWIANFKETKGGSMASGGKTKSEKGLPIDIIQMNISELKKEHDKIKDKKSSYAKKLKSLYTERMNEFGTRDYSKYAKGGKMAKGGSIDKNKEYKGVVIGFKDSGTGRAFNLGEISIPKNSTSQSIMDLAISKYERVWYVEVADDNSNYLYEISDEYSKDGQYPMVTSYANGGSVDLANTILKQIGGMNRLVMFTGAKKFAALPNGVSFKIGNRSINYVRITLNGRDLYDMEFALIRGGKMTNKKDYTDIYSDQLKSIFEKATGMYLSFEKGGMISSNYFSGMLSFLNY